jgi:hypothetical protein
MGARLLLATLLTAIALAGCSGTDFRNDVGSAEDPIVGGQETPPCAWPTTVDFKEDLGGGVGAACTATLIHPQVISLAAHCTEEAGATNLRAVFGDTDNPGKNGKTVPITKCTARPGGVNAGQDFAFCILSQPVDIPIIPVLFGCETSVLQVGGDVVLVGFGNISENQPSPNGHKRFVHAKIDRIRQYSIDIGDPKHQNCFGDSGGPAFVQLADGTWRVFGATSTTNTPACASLGTWALIPPWVSWLEQQSGFDVTPCYDAATGAYEPGPKCTGFPLNPEVTDGTWANMCTESLTLSGPVAACGGDGGAPPPPIDSGVRDAQRTDAGADGGRSDAGNATGTGGTGGASAGTGGAGGSTGGSTTGSAGSAGSGGSAGTGVTMTTGPTSTSSTGSGKPTATSTIDGGCACRFSTQDRARGPALVAMVLGATIANARRRRRTAARR